jgi:hypothetical protein
VRSSGVRNLRGSDRAVLIGGASYVLCERTRRGRDWFNAHFLRDVGLAYVTLTVGAAFALFRPEYALPVTAMAAADLLGHAALHVFMEIPSLHLGMARPCSPRRQAFISGRLRSCTGGSSSVRGSPAAFLTKNLTNREGCCRRRQRRRRDVHYATNSFRKPGPRPSRKGSWLLKRRCKIGQPACLCRRADIATHPTLECVL